MSITGYDRICSGGCYDCLFLQRKTFLSSCGNFSHCCFGGNGNSSRIPGMEWIFQYDGYFICQHVCSGCGACENACPTEAIQIGSPSQEEIFERFKKALNPNKISFACKQISSEAHCIPVGCFSRLSPGLLLLAKAAGAKNIELVSGKCENCLRNNGSNPTNLCA